MKATVLIFDKFILSIINIIKFCISNTTNLIFPKLEQIPSTDKHSISTDFLQFLPKKTSGRNLEIYSLDNIFFLRISNDMYANGECKFKINDIEKNGFCGYLFKKEKSVYSKIIIREGVHMKKISTVSQVSLSL